MKFREGDRVELILRSKKRVGTVEEVYNDTQKCKVQIDGFPVTVTKPQKYLVKVEGSELVVVPQFVADWISHRRQEGYNLIWSISYENNDMPDEVYEWLTSTADNQELFARAWLDGYEVEKEPVWVVENENGYRLRSITMNPGNSLNWSFDSKNKNYIEFEEFETAKKAAYLVTGNVTEI
ncbi:DUF1642 domain-containing protein [Listeria monocytogenes]|nr:DUF1642 domain-containing protein [Listeria monocytogenes]